MESMAVYVWWVNSGVEGLLTVMSLIAAVLHYRAAEKKLSRVTKFHLIHWLFCLWLTTCGLIWVSQKQKKNYVTNYCSMFNNIWNVGDDVLFAFTWYTFAEYWEQVLANSKQRRQGIRAAVMGVLAVVSGVTYLWPTLAGKTECKRYEEQNDIHLAFIVVSYSVYPLCLGADALRLGLICYKRVYDVASAYPTFNKYDAMWQAKYYFGLAISFLLASILFNYDMPNRSNWFTGQFFMFVVPGMLMVAATWRRNYLTVSRDTISTTWSFNYDDDGYESNRSLGGLSSKGGGFEAIEDARASALLLPPGAPNPEGYATRVVHFNLHKGLGLLLFDASTSPSTISSSSSTQPNLIVSGVDGQASRLGVQTGWAIGALGHTPIMNKFDLLRAIESIGSNAKSDVPIHFLIPPDEVDIDIDSNTSDVENPVGAGYVPPNPSSQSR